MVSSKMVLGKPDRDIQKNEPGLLSYTIHKNKLKIDEGLKHKTRGENRQQPL